MRIELTRGSKRWSLDSDVDENRRISSECLQRRELDDPLETSGKLGLKEMPGGVVFLVCIPTLSYEHELIFGVPVKSTKRNDKSTRPEQSNKVDLRIKDVKNRTHLITLDDDSNDEDEHGSPKVEDLEKDVIERTRNRLRSRRDFAPTGLGNRAKSPVFVPMETVS